MTQKPDIKRDADLQIRELQEAAALLKRQINIVRASSESEIDTAFATVAQQGATALLVAQDPYFHDRREQLAQLAVRHRLPGSYALILKGESLLSSGSDDDEIDS